MERENGDSKKHCQRDKEALRVGVGFNERISDSRGWGGEQR